MSGRLPVPRLLAVTPEGWADGWQAQLRTFTHLAQPLVPRAAVWLRAHDRHWSWWQAALTGSGLHQQVGNFPQSIHPALAVGLSAPEGEPRALVPMIEAAGLRFVHLAEAVDLSAWLQARDQLAPHLAVSRACHDAAGVARALQAGCDWALLSPILPTPSKPGVPPLGLPLLAEVARRHPGGVVALGGVEAEQAADVLATGAAGVACLRAAWGPDARRLVDACLPAA